MEPLFSNEFQLTGEIFLEFLKKVYRVNKKGSRYFYIAIMIICCFLSILFCSHEMWNIAVLLILLALYYFYYAFFRYRTIAKSSYKSLNELCGPIIYQMVSFFDEYIEDSSSKKSILNFTYDKITNILETKNMYILMIGNQSKVRGAIVKKDSFIGIDKSEFLAFIKDKCPNIK